MKYKNKQFYNRFIFSYKDFSHFSDIFVARLFSAFNLYRPFCALIEKTYDVQKLKPQDCPIHCTYFTAVFATDTKPNAVYSLHDLNSVTTDNLPAIVSYAPVIICHHQLEFNARFMNLSSNN